MRTTQLMFVSLAAAAVCLALPTREIRARESRTAIPESYHSETVLDASVEEVWPYALDIKTWMNGHDLETVAGTPNTVGEIVKITPRNTPPSAPREHYAFYQVTKIIPRKQIVIKVYSAPGGTLGKEVLEYDAITLFDEQGRTRVVFDMNGESIGPHIDASELEKEEKAEDEEVYGLLEAYWKNLAALVAKGARHQK